MDCLAQAGLEAQTYLRRIPLHAPLPWDHVDSLVKKEFIIRDLHAGMKGRFLPACEKPFIPRDPQKTVKPLEHANLVCYHCGLDCDLEAIKRERIAQRDSLAPPAAAIAAAFRGEKAPAAGNVQLQLPKSNDVARPDGPEARQDGLATNAFEAAQGIFHGESAIPTAAAAGASVAEELPSATGQQPKRIQPSTARRLRYRVWFSKRGRLRWLSHLDLLRALQRASRRAEIPVTYSQGFHPAPLMSFGPALAVGIEGAGEVFDFESSHEQSPSEIMRRLNASLPTGLRIESVQRLPEGALPLSKRIDLGVYRAWVNDARRRLDADLFRELDTLPFGDAAWQNERITTFLERRVTVVKRAARAGKRSEKPGKEVDIRPFVRTLCWEPESASLRLELRLGSQGQARPQEVLEALYGVPSGCFRLRRESLETEAVLSPHRMEMSRP
jgi:radical SAM-linked protein